MEKTVSSIVDMQVNIGKTAFGPNCDFETYHAKTQELGITKAMIVPTPTHIFQTTIGEETSCLWKPNANPSQRYYKELRKESSEIEIIDNPRHPYQAFNQHILQFVKAFNESRQKLRLYFAAKVHPFLDDPQCLEGLLDDNLVCLKIHGIASHSHPNIFPQWLDEFLRHHNLPVLVHTDWYEGEIGEQMSPYVRALHELYRENSPLAYIHWALRNKLKVCINHGARLHNESIHIINNEPDLMMGYGPDSLLDAEWDRLAMPTVDYAAALFEHASPDKVMFSTDYRWNVDGRNQWNNLRWDSIERIRRVLGPADQDKVLARNAINFYKMKN